MWPKKLGISRYRWDRRGSYHCECGRSDIRENAYILLILPHDEPRLYILGKRHSSWKHPPIMYARPCFLFPKPQNSGEVRDTADEHRANSGGIIRWNVQVHVVSICIRPLEVLHVASCRPECLNSVLPYGAAWARSGLPTAQVACDELRLCRFRVT